MNATKVITGVLAGVVVGILIAPRKGSETRKKLSDSVNDLSDCIQDIIEVTREKVNALADKGVENVENMESQLNEVLAD
jgi:gas vesicle protein